MKTKTETKTEFTNLFEKAGLTNKGAAELYGVNVSTIKRWKNGSTTVKKRTLMIIENLLNNKVF